MASADQIRSSRIASTRTVLAATQDVASAAVCPLCGASDTQPAFKDSGCELRVCNLCELFFVHPYPASHRQHEMVASGEYAKIELLDCESRYQGEQLYYERHFSPIAEECNGAASLLDVGCGTGHLLERFAHRPELHRVGLELNEQAAQFARRVSGCEIFEAPFERFQPGRKFDVVTMINVLSHIPSFEAMFRGLRGALAPGGKVILRTSEMACTVSRWNQMHWGIPDDLHFLGLRTLDFLCARYGFAVKRCVRTPYEEELFLRSRWQQIGRNPWLNLAKRTGVRIPGALPMLKKLYTAALGHRLFVSFIVLKRLPDSGGTP